MTELLDLVARTMSERTAPRPFLPGISSVPYSGAVVGGEEYRAIVESLLSGWFGLGEKTEAFEKAVAARMSRKRGLFVNSGSSANLVALTALCSRHVEGHLSAGDEVVTCVSGFPTTLNPILQNGLRVKFVDTSLPTYNPTGDMLVEAVSSRTKALMFGHTLGNPYDMRVVVDLVRDYDLWLVEDCCDALGSTYGGRPAGSFGDLATCSFYPAHHITTGEGGLVAGDDTRLMRTAESLRDWGRDCWCAPGKDDTCGKRFNWRFPDLPEGYDHKYVYSEIGYNLKPLELQAAMGLVQLNRLDGFDEVRRRNFEILKAELKSVSDLITLPQPTPCSSPSWFAFPITLNEGLGRAVLIQELTTKKIATRMLFGSNLLRQPAYVGRGLGNPAEFPEADRVMMHTFFVGTSPVVTAEMAHFVGRTIMSELSDLSRK